MIDKHFWKFVCHWTQTFSQLNGVRAAIPLSCRHCVYQYAERRREEANVPVFYADHNRDTVIHCYQTFCWQMFNLWTIKWSELHTWINFQRVIVNCCMLAFTETCLDLTLPDSAVTPAVFSIYRQDRTMELGKHRGGGVCIVVNSGVQKHFSPDLEFLVVKVSPFYLRLDFSSAIAVNTPPHADHIAVNILYHRMRIT